MSDFDPQRPSTQFVTASGVLVTVDEDWPPAPAQAPEPLEEEAPVVIRPPALAVRERDAIMRKLFDDHGAWIQERLLYKTGIVEESTKDLGQRVLLVLNKHVEREGAPPEHVRGYLVRVIRNLVSNHRRKAKLDVDPDADAEAELGCTPDPEEALDLLERWQKTARYMRYLSEVEADAFQCVDLDGLSIDDAAEVLDRARGTVSTQLTRAREKLELFAEESEEAAALGGGYRREG